MQRIISRTAGAKLMRCSSSTEPLTKMTLYDTHATHATVEESSSFLKGELVQSSSVRQRKRFSTQSDIMTKSKKSFLPVIPREEEESTRGGEKSENSLMNDSSIQVG